jgi:multicomponent Na+:H+ antiporter subunit G
VIGQASIAFAFGDVTAWLTVAAAPNADVMLEVLGVALIAVGVLVTGLSVYGVVRLKGLYARLHAASKSSVMGTVAILAGSIGTRDGAMAGRAALVAAFLLLTTPVAAHVIANAAYRRARGVQETAVAEAAEDETA